MAQLKKYPFVSVNAGVNWQKVDPALLAALNRYGRAHGQVVTLTSGFRTYEQQSALYETYRKSGFSISHIAAKPGQSNHERGGAVDALIGGRPLGKQTDLAEYGLKAPVRGDPVHVELVGKTAGAQPSRREPNAGQAPASPQSSGDFADTATTLAPPSLGTPPAAQDPGVEMPGSAQHFLPGSDYATSWQQIRDLPDLSPDMERYLTLANGG